MSKIKNYTIKSPVTALDKWVGSNGTTGETKNFTAQGVADFTLSGLTPIEGGTFKTTEIEISTLDTDVATTVNAITPSYDVAQYEQVWFNIEGLIYVLKSVDVTIGVGGVTLTNDDFIIVPANTGASGLNAVMTRTSSDPLTVAGSGTKTLTYISTPNLGWIVGMRLIFTASPSYMVGLITAVSDTSVSISVDEAVGLGNTLDTWTIGVTGSKGATGSTGSSGLNADMTRVSVTSNAIANSGGKTFTYTASTNLGWGVGTRLRFAKDVSNYMEGVVTAVSSTSVTATMDNSKGSGTYTAWNIGIAGDVGTVSVGSIVTENTSGALTITTQSQTNLDYIAHFQLEGKKCFVNGTIENTTGSSQSNTPIATFINSAYYGNSSITSYIFYQKSDGTVGTITVTGNLFYLTDAIPNGVSVAFTGFYYTN